MLQAIEPERESNFSMREARDIVKDLFEPRPLIYWTDLLVSFAVAVFCLRQIRQNAWFTPWQTFGYVVGILAFYRCASFTHELAHLRTGSFKRFRVTWNLLCGIPFLMPSFMYTTHVAHHAKNHYATRDDGEYIPLANGPRRNIFLYMSQVLLIPIVAVLRFLVFAPLGWISPSFRQFVHRHVSSLVMDPRYIRPLPSAEDLQAWKYQEVGCFLFALLGAVVFSTGLVEITYLPRVYLLAVGVMFMNQLRTLGAHRFLYAHGPVTFVEQLVDSVNYPRWPMITGLWAPIGLRYHALHHMFPSLPYHALDEAHHRLMARLPADSPYRQTNSPGLWSSLALLWQRAGRQHAEVRPAAQVRAELGS